ncbi:MAG: ABC transporter ATP-binding protein [bacterium]|nr:ABC transporter ATP-binding protein [bacterium]
MKSLNKQTLGIYWEHARKYKGAIFLLAVGLMGAVAAEAYAPFMYRRFFNLLVDDPSNTAAIIKTIWLIFFAGGLGWVSYRISDFTLAKFEARVMRDIVNTCFKYLHDHSYSFFSNTFTGSLVRKINRYERSFEEITDKLFWNLSSIALKVSVIVVVLYFVHWALALAVLIWSLFYIGFSIGYAVFKLKYDQKLADVDSVVSGRLADTITNNINLKLYGGTSKEFKSFTRLTSKLFETRYLAWWLSNIGMSVQIGLMFALEVIMLFVAFRFWRVGLLTIGDFALVQGFVGQLFGRLWDLGHHIKSMYERFADASEMTEILLTPHEVKDAEGSMDLKFTKGEIEFKDVSFAYQVQQKVFAKFDLKIKPGERVALIGPSGGGKTTIVKILLRFFDIQKGKILIDGQDISQVTQVSLRDNLSLVPQEPILFHRSLYENIAYGRSSASKQEIIHAAKMAHCSEFISKFPEGYDTFVGERGVKLSGGERQRVAIARAILKNAPILILDEATSSLDSESEMFIQDALKNLMAGRTTIVIAHRLSTIMQMDRIVVIEDGKIIEEGKHEELLKAKQGTYQKLWEIQAGGFSS